MKLKKFLALFSKCDPNSEIIMASDAEGNGFNYADNVSDAYFAQYKDPEFDIEGDLELYDEDDLGELDKDIKPKKCVVLWPR